MRCSSRKLFVFCILGAILASRAGAAPLTWTLSGASFDDGSTLSGSFVFDASTGTVSAWSISVALSPTMPSSFPAYTYSPATSTPWVNAGYTLLEFEKGDTTGYIDLAFVTALTNAGGTVSLVTDLTRDINQGTEDARDAVSGFVSTGTSGVPEPGSLLPAGLALLPLIAFRKRRA